MKKIIISLTYILLLASGCTFAQLTPQQVDCYKGTASGTDTYSVTISCPNMPTTPYDGEKIWVKFSNANTGASTLKVNSMSSYSITLNGVAVASGDIPANQYIGLIYYATGLSWQLQFAPSGSSNSWLTTGNALTGTEHSPTEFFGSTNNFDVVFKENNAELMRFYDAKVGIGSTAPTQKLELLGTNNDTIQTKLKYAPSGPGTAGGAGVFLETDGGRTFLMRTSEGQPIPSVFFIKDDDQIRISANAIEGFKLDNAGTTTIGQTLTALTAGNVGIGTIAPVQKLELSGGAKFINSGARLLFGAGRFSVSSDTVTGTDLTVNATAMTYTSAITGGNIFYADGNTGFLGIKTSAAPDVMITLDGGNARTMRMTRRAGTNNPGHILTIQAGGASTGATTDQNGGNLKLAGGISTGTGSSSVEIQTATPTASGTTSVVPTTKVFVDGNGNVGIGTSAPGNRLEVFGSGTSTANKALATYNLSSTELFSVYNSGQIYAGVSNNLLMGSNSGLLITSGTLNTSFGVDALKQNVSGSSNSAFGLSALQNNTGSGNTAFGTYGLANNIGGIDNCAFGKSAMVNHTTGNYNTAIGSEAMFSSSGGSNNCAIGFEALYNNTGSDNVAVGVNVCGVQTSGTGNTAIGTYAALNNVTGDGNVTIGYYAGKYNTASNAFYINNQDRGNTSNDKTLSLMYGVFDALPENQTLSLNARVGVNTGTATPTSALNVINTNTSIPTFQAVGSASVTINYDGSIKENAVCAGTNSFSTTAATDTVTIAGAATTDYYFVQIVGNSGVTTLLDIITVEAISTGLVVHRTGGVGSTSGLAYNWIRRKQS